MRSWLLYTTSFNSCKLTSSDEVEADVFYCFSVMMSEQKDLFVPTLDHDPDSGIIGKIGALNRLLKELDYPVYKRLLDNGVDPTFYSLRWLMLLLAQELSMQDTIRLWD